MSQSETYPTYLNVGVPMSVAPHIVQATPPPPFEEWVILELLGHRRLAGHLTEQRLAGALFLRLDIPATHNHPAATQLYPPASVYCITPTTEETARKVAAWSWQPPVQPWELPVAPEPVEGGAEDEQAPF